MIDYLWRFYASRELRDVFAQFCWCLSTSPGGQRLVTKGQSQGLRYKPQAKGKGRIVKCAFKDDWGKGHVLKHCITHQSVIEYLSYVQDDEEDFEHLNDEDEFEGFDKERTPKKSHEQPPDLKITKVYDTCTLYSLLLSVRVCIVIEHLHVRLVARICFMKPAEVIWWCILAEFTGDIT